MKTISNVYACIAMGLYNCGHELLFWISIQTSVTILALCTVLGIIMLLLLMLQGYSSGAWR